ncbi:MAG TPA: hypothetical protein VIV40_02070 [Kofleriaceae bacterium]
MGRAVALVCLLAGCGRLGFGLGDDDHASADAPDITADIGGDAAPSMVALVQASTTVNSPGGTVTLPFGSPTTAGTLLVATFGANDISNLVLPAGWMIAQQAFTSGGCFAVVAYQANNPGGITSIDLGQPSLLPTVAVATEWTGITASSPLDAIGLSSGGAPMTTQTVQTATPTVAADELAISVFGEDVGMPQYSGDPTWQLLGTASNTSSSPSFIAQYKRIAVPGAVGTTVTSSVAGKYAAAIVTFRSQ